MPPPASEEGHVGQSLAFGAGRLAGEEVQSAFIGHAPAFQEVALRIGKLAKADGTVLIEGETGTGKELAARAIHRLSRRAP